MGLCFNKYPWTWTDWSFYSLVRDECWRAPGGSDSKEFPTVQETSIQSLGWADLLEKGMATHSSILAWRIPRTEEPYGLWSMGSQRVRHDWMTNTFIGYECWRAHGTGRALFKPTGENCFGGSQSICLARKLKQASSFCDSWCPHTCPSPHQKKSGMGCGEGKIGFIHKNIGETDCSNLYIWLICCC